MVAQTVDPPLGRAQVYMGDYELVMAQGRSAELVEPPRAQHRALRKGGHDASGEIVDVAVADFGDAESMVVATSSQIQIRSDDDVSLPAPPSLVAVAAADVGSKSVAALTSSGQLHVCTLVGECEVEQLGPIGVDVASAKLLEGRRYLAVTRDEADDHTLWHWAAEGIESLPLGNAPSAMAAADVDGDSEDEIFMLEDGGYFGYGGDVLTMSRLVSPALVERARVSVAADSIDVAAGDIDGDGKAEVVVLAESGGIQVFEFTSSGLVLEAEDIVEPAAEAVRLALLDVDGDSARAELVEGPTLVTGNPVVTAAVSFPPYDADVSAGLPKVSIGHYEVDAQFSGDSVKVKVGAQVGVTANLPGIFKAKMAAKVSQSMSAGTSGGYWQTFGERVSVTARPDLFGDRYGVVLLSTACYAAFTYEVVDPAGHLGADAEEMVVLIPTGGETSLWSSPRYNQLARARGDLPEIEVSTQLGNLSSYPAVPSSIDGRPLQRDELVFEESPVFVVSDVAHLGWGVSAGEYDMNIETSKADVSASAAVSMSGFTFGVTATDGVGESFTVILGESVSFRGGTPPIPDDPDTPEDDYAENAFSFSPVVYKHSYEGPEGQEMGFFALAFTVGGVTP
jgi:hypothetical protein